MLPTMPSRGHFGWNGNDDMDAEFQRERMTPTAGSCELLRQQHRRDMLSRVPAFLARAAWPAERIGAEREQRLRRLLAHAKRHSPWHARRLTSIDPETVTEADLRRLPTMTKFDLMANFDEIITDNRVPLAVAEAHLLGLEHGSRNPYLLDAIHVVASSGSSGPRALFAYDWNGWTVAGLSVARFAALVGREVQAGDDRVTNVSVGAEFASHFSVAIMQSFFPGTAMVSATLPMQRIIERLNRLQPTSIGSYPSVLQQLCGAAESGQLQVRPAAFASSGECLSSELRSALERIFSAKVFDGWACSESAMLAQSCARGPDLHLNDDIAIVEPVDERAEPVAAGTESATVLITNLFNTLLPLIRYEITDRVTILDRPRPCVCGSQFRTIASVGGRSSDAFTYDGGVDVYTWVWEAILERNPTVIDYRVLQTPRGVHVLVTSTPGFDRKDVAAEIDKALVSHGLRDPEVVIEMCAGISRGATGKQVRSVPLRQSGPRLSPNPAKL
jgi:phenylacetate-CoA ligase